MKKVRKVKIYFDEKSSKYQVNSISFPWNIIRKFEKRIVLSFLGKTKKLVVADVGSGSGFYTKIILKDMPKELYAIDNSYKMLSQIKEKKIKKVVQNIELLKLNKKFDKLICAGLIEFTTKPLKALININKIAKKDATLVLLCPKDNFFGKIYKFFHLKNNLKINLFSISEIKYMLNKSKWKILKQDEFLFSMIFKLKKNV